MYGSVVDAPESDAKGGGLANDDGTGFWWEAKEAEGLKTPWPKRGDEVAEDFFSATKTPSTGPPQPVRPSEIDEDVSLELDGDDDDISLALSDEEEEVGVEEEEVDLDDSEVELDLDDSEVELDLDESARGGVGGGGWAWSWPRGRPLSASDVLPSSQPVGCWSEGGHPVPRATERDGTGERGRMAGGRPVGHPPCG
jgi:hypothetical protein